jgi:hypothetical protein
MNRPSDLACGSSSRGTHRLGFVEILWRTERSSMPVGQSAGIAKGWRLPQGVISANCGTTPAANAGAVGRH